MCDPIKGACLVLVPALVTGLLTASVAFADPASSPPSTTQPTVVVTVPGGLSGALFGQILEATFEVFTPPTENYQVRSGDTVCSILRARNYPPPCMPIVRALYRLNPGLEQHAENLSSGESISLPLFEVTANRATASVPASTRSESQAATAEDVRLESEKTAKSAYAYFGGHPNGTIPRGRYIPF
jgi:phage tail protein X